MGWLLRKLMKAGFSIGGTGVETLYVYNMSNFQNYNALNKIILKKTSHQP